jgi:hypothetical protein
MVDELRKLSPMVLGLGTEDENGRCTFNSGMFGDCQHRLFVPNADTHLRPAIVGHMVPLPLVMPGLATMAKHATACIVWSR